MQKSDVKRIVDLPPRERAVQYLVLGAELAKRAPPKKPKSPLGRLPAQLKRKSIRDSVAAPVLEFIHGIDTETPVAKAGLRSTGRRLATAVGEIDDLVLTPVARKRVATRALVDTRDRSVNDTAKRELALGMLDSDPIARCCAAYGYWQATRSAAAFPILENAVSSDDDDERLVAAHCLAKADSKRVRDLQGTAADDRAPTATRKLRSSMTVIVHGTFAKDSTWYSPGGDFHSYIKEHVYPDVYSGRDYFFWSGRYSRTDAGLRRIWKTAANKLVSWLNAHPARKLRLIAHSHGNNVVNMATKQIEACSLIQLSPPVRAWNLPHMDNVSSGRLFNIHSTLDVVVMIDGGAQDYSGTAVAANETTRIISRYGHTDSHVPKRWKKKKIPALVKSVCD